MVLEGWREVWWVEIGSGLGRVAGRAWCEVAVSFNLFREFFPMVSTTSWQQEAAVGAGAYGFESSDQRRELQIVLKVERERTTG